MINRLQSVFLGPCLLILTLLVLSSCTTDERSEEQRVADARISLEKYRYREAIIEMRNLLRRNGNNAEARLILGKALLGTGDMETAQKEAERARELELPPDLYIETLARAMQGAENHIELIAEIDPDSVNDPELASTLRALRGRSMLEIGSIDEAVKVFDAELAARGSVEAQRISLLGKATLDSAAGEFESAERLMQRAIALNPDSPESVLALGRIYLTQEKFEFAKALLGKARTELTRARRQDWFFVEGQYVESLLGLGELDAARESTTVLQTIGEVHPMTAYLLGRVEFESGNSDKAIELFQQVLSEYPTYAPAQTLMGIVMIQREDFDQAEMHLANAVSNSPENVRARKLLAETRLRMGRDKAAVRTLKDGLGLNNADADLLTMLGRAKVRSGEEDAGLQHLQQAYTETPDSVQAGLALASAYLSNGDSEAAIRTINSLPDQSISAQRRQILIRVAQLDNNNQARAEAQIEQLLTDAPDDTYVMGLAGSFYAATNQLDKARNLFTEILELYPGNRAAMLNILNLDERIDDYSQSMALFEYAHQDDPRDLLPALVLARIYESTGNKELAIRMITDANQINPKALLPNLMLAAEALRSRNYAEAERLAGIAVKEYPNSARAHALLGFAEMYLGKVMESKNDFQRAVVLNPETVQYRYFLGKAAWANGQILLARQSFENVVRSDANHLPATHALGVLLAQSGKNKQAETILETITSKFESSRATLIAAGEVRAALGQLAEAINDFEAAQELRSTWQTALMLFKLKGKTGHPDPTQPLHEWREMSPEDSRPQLKIAQFHHAAGDIEAATSAYEQALALDPNSIVTLNNLAWIYFDRGYDGDHASALTLAKKAYELSNGTPEIADTYGWILYKTGDARNGRAVLRDAFQQTSASDSPDIAYHYAVVLENHGLQTSAKTILEDALTTDKAFSSRAEAQQLFDALSDSDSR